MIRPLIAPRMKYGNQSTRHWVNSSQIRTFVQVTPVTCECKIVDLIRTTMFPGNNVLDVMRQFAVRLVKAAILAPISSPATD
jgi:hypothetical protein